MGLSELFGSQIISKNKTEASFFGVNQKEGKSYIKRGDQKFEKKNQGIESGRSRTGQIWSSKDL